MGRSIRGRVERLGGRVDFVSTPGDGADVRMSIPLRARRKVARG
jgi:signal transduction histidine kinase